MDNKTFSSNFEWLKNEPSAPVPCPVCGNDMEYNASFVTKTFYPADECKHCKKSAEQEAAMAEQEVKLEYIKDNIDNIVCDHGVPLKYKLDVSTIEPPDGELKTILESILSGKSAYIYGFVGRGKSTFAVYAMKQLIINGTYPP